MRAFSRVWCFLFRWKVVPIEDPIPTPCVVIAAPHTSNWDFFALIASARLNDVDIRWLGKSQMFDGPLARVFRALGGIPVDRTAPGGIVGEMVHLLSEDPTLMIVVPAEGTRTPTEFWKSGFYRIAKEAGVPIQLSYVDGRTRTSGFGPHLLPSGDVSADMDVIRAFYADKVGINPDQFMTPRLREEVSAGAT